MAQQWSGKTGGTHWMQRALVGMYKYVDSSFVYGIMHFWLIWYIIVRRSVARGAYIFHRRRGRSRLNAAIDVYRSFYHFGQAVVDRFAVYAGVKFAIRVDNSERYYDNVKRKDGFILLFSHVGNSEMAAYTMATPDKKMNIIAYGGESPVVMENRAKVLAENNIGMIVVQPDSMDHIFCINDALQRGEVLAIAGDRKMGDNTINCHVLGADAKLPAGPFELCVTLRCPVVLTFVIKESKKTYHTYTELLQVDYSLPRHERAHNLAQQYASRIEQMALEHPYQWFNFFDFWA